MNDRSSEGSQDMAALLSRLEKEDYCYLTTAGRVSGRPHEIEIWFAIQNSTIYLLSGSGDRSDWVKNLVKNPAVTVRIAKHAFLGEARIVRDKEEDAVIRPLLAAKYQGWHKGRPLSNWARTALPVAIDLAREVAA